MNLFPNACRSSQRPKEPVVTPSKNGMSWPMRLRTALQESESPVDSLGIRRASGTSAGALRSLPPDPDFMIEIPCRGGNG